MNNSQERIYTAYRNVAFYEDVCKETGESLAKSPLFAFGSKEYEAIISRTECVVLNHNK